MSASIPIAELELHDHHRIALRRALEFLPGIAEPVGIVVSGSIIRGNPHRSSDLDIVVLHD
jgi:predicted nucleotidyltransferase